MKNLIISLAIDGREKYSEIQKGLITTLPVAGDFDRWILNAYPPDITPHTSVPYLFKFDLIKKAVDEGYTKIAWMDATMRLLKNPFELLEASEQGVVAFDNIGHPAWKYCTDRAASNLRQYYEDIYDVAQTWGGCLLFDFNKPYAHKILTAIFHQASIGSFEYGEGTLPGFVAGRNDQTVLSFLFHFYKIPLLEYGIIAAKQHVSDITVVQYGE